MYNIDDLEEISVRMIANVRDLTPRFTFDSIANILDNRLILIKGFRGVGKTTLMLHLANKFDGLYFSVDHPYVVDKGIYDLTKSFINRGYNLIFIDEIHKFPNWRQHVKSLYEEYPSLHLILSGSPPLAFTPDRRHTLIDLNFLTFREFLYLQHKSYPASYDEWKDRKRSLSYLGRFDLSNFDDYVYYGGLPIYFSSRAVLEKIYNSIRKSIWEDSLTFSSVKLGDIQAMEQILFSLATSYIGELSINSLSKNLGITKYKAYHLINLLQEMQIVRLILPYGKGYKRIRGSPKMIFSHPSIRTAICNALNEKPDIGAIREELSVFSFIARGYNVFTVKGKRKNPDYIIVKNKKHFIVEIGGDNKTKSQFEGKNGIIITPPQLKVLAMV